VAPRNDNDGRFLRGDLPANAQTMKRLRTNTSLLAVTVAAGLFLIANHFDNRAPWQPRNQSPALMKPARDSVLDGPVRTMDTAGTCATAEEGMREAVAESQFCETDDDCTLFDYGYPIQCMTSVARSEITALRLRYRDYENSCRFRVYYDCPTDNAERIAVCRNRHCAVQLETIDQLKEETMQHIGNEQ
jgi:hypothetical protein